MVQQTPYTLYRSYKTVLRDYTDYKKDHMPGERNSIATTIKRVASEGKIELSERELSIVKKYDEVIDSIRYLIDSLPEKEADEVINRFNGSEYATTISRLFNDNLDIMQLEGICGASARVIASVSTNPTLTDIYMAGILCENINNYRTPLSDQIMEWADKNLQLPAARSMVTAMQDKYLALTGASLDKISIKSADKVKDMSDGEKILRKLTEPYRGRYVLVDVWGTWCGPCKAALAKSKEEFERLAPYNMVFLYLANRSSDESWKNVIKEYNVVGENVAHYNLPDAQQTAVENFLKVSSYPTYKLISPDGDVLDVNADPRDLDAFERMIKAIK
jgi:thiol-disulfide isomerase/thioredoxin